MEAHAEPVVILVLATILMVLVVSRRWDRPYPVLLVVGGLIVGSLPWMPVLRIDPDVVLLGVLPPLIFWPAFLSSPREMRRHAGEILSLAVALVLATTAGVAVFARIVVGLPWDVAFVLGAVVSATDPVASTATLRRAAAPRRALVVLEGEGLVNDAAALVAYTVAVEAVVAGSFSPSEAALQLVVGAVAGVAIGLAVGWLLSWAVRHLMDPLDTITLVLFGAYFAYLPAEWLGVSAVLAAVSAGLLFGWLEPRVHRRPMARIAGFAFWEELIFLLHALVFFAIGAQLPAVLDGVEEYRVVDLALWTAAIVGATIGLRIVWVMLLVWLPRHHRHRGEGARGSWRECVIKAWSGMRGVVSVAAALAIPLTDAAGRPFPDRDLVIFLAYGTVVATLVLQGGTLPLLVRLLGVETEDVEAELARARAVAAQAALARIAELSSEPWAPPDCTQTARQAYEEAVRRFAARADGKPQEEIERAARHCAELRDELIEAERDALFELREQGEIGEDIYRHVLHQLDLAYAHLVGEPGHKPARRAQAAAAAGRR